MSTSFLSGLTAPFKALAVRFEKAPVNGVASLEEFVQTRASYIAQTALYGYLKARMGTRYRVMFEDEVFSRSIRSAAIKVFASCLSDLTVYAVALVVREGLEPEDAGPLAERIYGNALERHLSPDDIKQVPEALDVFRERVQETLWANTAVSAEAFRRSEADLLRHAPVVDAFKEQDEEIVGNSIRFKWRDVREQLDKRLDAGKLLESIRR